mgnify:FL=1
MLRVTFSHFFLLLAFLVLPLFTHAQFLGNLNGVTINLTPQHPRPHQTVEATVRSGNVDVSSATIVWLINDELLQQESGGTSFIFETPAEGQMQQLTVLVKTIDGQVLSDTVAIRPASVTLLWEARTWTPPFYKSRALYTPGSTIVVEARASIEGSDGRKYEPNELLYTWRRNDSVLGNQSGLGKSTLIIEGPKFFSDDVMSVEVSTPDRSIIATSAALIETRDPLVLLYEEDPLLGVVYNRSVENDHVFRATQQISLVAAPFYMDARKLNDRSLTYEWQVQGRKIETNANRPSYVTLSFTTADDFSANASVSVEHISHLLQAATGNWLFHFEGGARATPFGR